ncbi:acyl-CoA carboxylase subunit epsilon [Streptomyces mirabilis]|uniref:acyl-CoA carboxylase subunit epsilon n=1 Tax=Streptomyces mirabilis TaxID=68239 RepID=UPI0036958BF3
MRPSETRPLGGACRAAGGRPGRAGGPPPPRRAPPGTRDSWSDPSRIAAQHLPQPGPTAWTRTYWPA